MERGGEESSSERASSIDVARTIGVLKGCACVFEIVRVWLCVQTHTETHTQKYVRAHAREREREREIPSTFSSSSPSWKSTWYLPVAELKLLTSPKKKSSEPSNAAHTLAPRRRTFHRYSTPPLHHCVCVRARTRARTFVCVFTHTATWFATPSYIQLQTLNPRP